MAQRRGPDEEINAVSKGKDHSNHPGYAKQPVAFNQSNRLFVFSSIISVRSGAEKGLPSQEKPLFFLPKRFAAAIKASAFRLSINLFLKIEQYKNNVRIHGHVPGILTP